MSEPITWVNYRPHRRYAKHVYRELPGPYVDEDDDVRVEEDKRPPPMRVRVRLKHFGWIALGIIIASVCWGERQLQEGWRMSTMNSVLQRHLQDPAPSFCAEAANEPRRGERLMNHDTVKFLEMALAMAKAGRIVGIGAIAIGTDGALQTHYSVNPQTAPYILAGALKLQHLALAEIYPEKPKSSLVLARPAGLPQ